MGKPIPVATGGGVSMKGPLLSFSLVESSHNGTYRCEVSNTFGSMNLDSSLIIASLPSVSIEPKKKIVKLGQSVELKCRVPSLSVASQITYVVSNAAVIWYRKNRCKTN